jgi:sporulation protein YlmC with PRC-barrel domain
MIRTLLATTALATVLALPATAQEAQPLETPMASSSVMPAASFDMSTGYTLVDTDRLASHIMGQPVYDGPAGDANNLGNINDLVLDANGDVQAVVIGVGGFLGIGEKQVAVPFSALQHVVAEDQTERFVISTTVEQLTAAPDFVTVDDQPTDGAAPMTPAPADVPPASAPAM